jgi:hypothetical protein
VPELEVQVRARAPARAARSAEPLAGGYLVADADAPAGEVGIERHPPGAERDLDQVPVALEAARRADGDYASRLCGTDVR